MDVDGAVGVDGGGFAAQGSDFAEDTNGLVGEGLEVLGVDAGSGFGGHDCGKGGGIGFGKEVGCGLRDPLNESRLHRNDVCNPSTPTHVTVEAR